jgi:hypothetical protein
MALMSIQDDSMDFTDCKRNGSKLLLEMVNLDFGNKRRDLTAAAPAGRGAAAPVR